MAVPVYCFPATVTWNSQTWNSTSGGPVMAEFRHDGEVVEDQTGSAAYPMAVLMPSKRVTVTIKLRDASKVYALVGATSTLTITLSSDEAGTATATVTCTTMKLVRAQGTQNSKNPHELELEFRHQSADGTTNPLSVA